MANGRLEIVRTGKGETSKPWVTLREMVDGDGRLGVVEGDFRMIYRGSYGFGEIWNGFW